MEMMLENNKVYIENKLREQEERIINEIQEKGSNAENKNEDKTPPRIVITYSYDDNDTNAMKTVEIDTNELVHAKTNIVSETYVEEEDDEDGGNGGKQDLFWKCTLNQFENFKRLAFLNNCLNLTSLNVNPY